MSNHSNVYKLTVPEYITHIKLSDARRKKPWRYSDRKDLPKKFLDGPEKMKKQYIWKQDKLYDVVNKEFVARNSLSAGTPNFRAISGNDVYAKMHERVRIQMVKQIKDSFMWALEQGQKSGFFPKPVPLKVMRLHMEVHTTPRHADWDMSNLWIYFKCLEDLLQSEGFILNDNIRHITFSGGAEFWPVSDEDQRMLVFVFTEETRPEITNHVLYGGPGGGKVFSIHETDGKAGDVSLHEDQSYIGISVRKRGDVVHGAVTEVINKIYWQMVRLNAVAYIPPLTRHHLGDAAFKALSDRGIPVTYG